MIRTKLITTLCTLTFFSLFFMRCKREAVILYTCSDPYSINYNIPQADNICKYPRAQLINKIYHMVLVEYPLQPSQQGDDFYLDIRYPECNNCELYHCITLSQPSSLFPSTYCVNLSKDFSFIIPSTEFVDWSSAKITGGGYFSGANKDSLTLNYTVHNSTSDYPAIFKGVSY